MTGVELIIVSSIIRKVVDLGRSYLGDNYSLHTGTRKMLASLEIQLPLIQSVLEQAEEQQKQITSSALDKLLNQLKDAAYEAEDVLDDFEAKRILKNIKGKGKVSEIASSSFKMVKTLFFSDKDLKRLESVVDKLDNVCMNMVKFKQYNLNHSDKGKEHSHNHGSETSSTEATDAIIFGRDREIELILDMILNVLNGDFYHQELDDRNLKQGEGEGSSSFWGLPTILTAAQKLFTQSRAVIPGRREQEEVPSRNRLTGSTITTIPALVPRTSSLIMHDVQPRAARSHYSGYRAWGSSTTSTPRMHDIQPRAEPARTYYSGYRAWGSSTMSTPRMYDVQPRAEPARSHYSGYRAWGSSTTSTPRMSTNRVTTSSITYGTTTQSSSTTSSSTYGAATQHSSMTPTTTMSSYFRGINATAAENWSATLSYSSAPAQSTYGSQIITTIAKPQSISKRNLPVIPIVGVGGVGKTAVAKKIYNDEELKEHFALRAWVYVSESCNATKIMQEILCSFNGDIIDPLMSLEIVGNKLKETITNHRFMLILDDLRESPNLIWNDLRSVLSHGEVGSVVVVTTQSRTIFDNTNTVTLPKVTLDVLQPDSFWELFQYYAFQNLNLIDTQEEIQLKLIGKQIAEKLHGLPLAGKVIGTLLNNNLKREFWDDIRGSDWWNNKVARENILPSIGVGYNYLDPELKQCFVFCSIFPKHYVFERERLVQMWIAHGFIQPGKMEADRLDRGEIRLEDIGREWFAELVKRSFFQLTLSDGKYVMHDLVWDLAKAVSSNEFCFIKSHDNHLPSLARHVGIDCDNSEVEWKCKESTRLRTVILFGNWTYWSAESISNIFAKYNGLRVLDLSYIKLDRNEPINAASRLSHLRFVDLSFTGIRMIPDEFCALYHLQVLDLRGCFFKNLPEGMNQLINLRHLYASSDTISLISNIGKLTMLQELKEFRIDKRKGHGISELMNMNEISGHLLLTNLNNVYSKEEAAKCQLDKKKYLKSLDLRFEYDDCKQRTGVKTEVLNTLKPVSSLEILKVGGCLWESFPVWVFSPHHDFYNLKVIHVYCFWLSSLPAFGELPSLEVLSFDNLQFIHKVGSEFYGRSNVVFRSLKELKFSRMSAWRDWSDAEPGKTVFPHLKKLHLENCSLLKKLPAESFTSSVVELILLWCPYLCNIETVLQRMPSLAHLSIRFELRNSLSINCTSLNSLEVMDLKHIEQLNFVGGLKSLVKLRKLVIDRFCEILEKKMNKEISREENEEQCLQFLTYLHLSHFNYSTQSLPRVGRLPALRTLLIEHSPAKEYTTEEESWFNQLKSLEKLVFRNCSNLISLPSQLHNSLKKLHIDHCPKMLSLPENGLPQSLVELYIDKCADLIRRCKPNQGDDWHKISHIPVVQFKEEIRII